MRELIDEFEYSGTKGNDFVHYHVFASAKMVKCPVNRYYYVTVDVLLLYLEEVFN